MSDKQPIVLAEDIRDAYMDYGVFGAKFLDERYALLARPWLIRFGPSFLAFQRRMLKTPGYLRDINDCDDFVVDARYWASVLHRNTRSDAALAFGRCFYKPDRQTDPAKPIYHAICVAACREDSAILPVFFEPQKPGIIELSYDEISSASLEF